MLQKNYFQKIDHKISKENKKLCEMEITLDKISMAIKILKFDKSPGVNTENPQICHKRRPFRRTNI